MALCAQCTQHCYEGTNSLNRRPKKRYIAALRQSDFTQLMSRQFRSQQRTCVSAKADDSDDDGDADAEAERVISLYPPASVAPAI